MVTVHPLSNGVWVVLDEMPAVRSVSFGVWVKNGSAWESPKENGISHFLEHMMFQGTKLRTAKQIAEESDDLGGQVNAYTTKEYTVFHTRVLDQQLSQAVDLLADMVLGSVFEQSRIKKEFQVISEEMKSALSDAEGLVHETIQEQVWQGSGLGQSILGTAETVGRLSQEDLQTYYQTHYIPKRMVLSLAGHFDRETVLEQLEQAFGRFSRSKEVLEETMTPLWHPGVKKIPFAGAQTHLLMAFPGVCRTHPLRYAAAVLAAAFGGGFGSILFQKIRQEQGLTYSVYCYQAQYGRAGLFAIYAGVAPHQVEETAERILQVMKEFRRTGLHGQLLEKTKRQLLTSYWMDQESTVNRMNANGCTLLLDQTIRSPEEMIAAIEHLTRDDVEEAMELLFDREKMAVCMVGPQKGELDEKPRYEMMAAGETNR